MSKSWRTGLIVLAVCGMCCSFPTSCGNTTLYVGDGLRGGSGDGGEGTGETFPAW
jgi:hypothetical protein